MIQAKDCKCYECGKQAVAFYPCIDPDIPQHPYCRKCLDELKERVMMEIFKIDRKKKQKILKPHNQTDKALASCKSEMGGEWSDARKGKGKFDPYDISLCPHCHCGTHTLYKGNRCGKCGGQK